ncbi:hypothetical protein PP175_13540 [Aneurinibacillus sp. Ricciae_BoGa-3]|uniref:hypothetical protein n=1 Tax=Aneurinibacillus sp. Ricciae_BoGa-3 TaxID=3022697 RepID=UPI00233FF6B2|nr:hypothetical protein [Aneurinibacillus sp. Ricciae_BoGa-3]WCK52479.1 hypothetical protein PP175_13540 [Aneurinibacillus sp. Ricciae_BoGa-3]
MNKHFYCEDCGVYTYYCNCLPSAHNREDNLLERLAHEKNSRLSEEELLTAIRMMKDSREMRLVIEPTSDGYYHAHIEMKSLI